MLQQSGGTDLARRPVHAAHIEAVVSSRSKNVFAYIGGRQKPLGITDPNDRAGAEVSHKNLIDQLADAVAARFLPAAAPAPKLANVAESIAGFLAMKDRRVAAGKLCELAAAEYRRDLNRFAEAFGTRAGSSLAAAEIEEWADKPTWSSSTQNNVLGTVQMMLRWSGVALSPPIVRPPKESRRADTILTDEQFAQVLVALRRWARTDIGELLEVLRETGARPQEIAQLRVDGVDWPNYSARLVKHKTRRKTGADRIIHFNSAAMKLLERQREKHGEGLLFRTRSGNYYRPPVIVRRLWYLSKQLGFRVIAYGLGRHSFATRALEAGIPDVLVAGLLGHKGTAMLHKHYSHVGENARALKDAAERASGKLA